MMLETLANVELICDLDISKGMETKIIFNLIFLSNGFIKIACAHYDIISVDL